MVSRSIEMKSRWLVGLASWALGMCLLFSGDMLAQGVEKGFAALRSNNFGSAQEIFQKNLRRAPTAARIGLAEIYATPNNPYFQPDTAHRYVLAGAASYAREDAKGQERLLDLAINKTTIAGLQDKIEAALYERVRAQNRRAAYEAYLSKYPQAKLAPEAAVMRDSLAFDSTRALDTYAGYLWFLTTYPAARQVQRAQAGLLLRQFTEETRARNEGAYYAFIDAHPASPYRAAAQDSLLALAGRGGPSAAGTASGYARFVRAFPQSPRAAEVWALLYETYTAELDPASFSAFLRDFPTYPDTARVKAELRSLYGPRYPAPDSSRWGYLDSTGQVVTRFQYDSADDYAGPLALVERGGKFGYLDRLGRERIPIRYEEAEPFRSGVAVVSLTETSGAGLIDTRGRWRLAPGRAVSIGRFSEGLAPARLRTLQPGDREQATGPDSLGYVSLAGRVVIAPQYADGGAFREGRAWVRQGKQTGFIDPAGRWVVPPRYDWAEDFAEGRARVRLGDKFGLIDTAGRELLPCIHRRIGPFQEGRALVALGAKYGFVDRYGVVVVPILYDFTDALATAESGAGYRLGTGKLRLAGKVGLADSAGRVVLALAYQDVGHTAENRTAVQLGGFWGYVGPQAKAVISPKYSFAGEFAEGLAVVGVKGKKGVSYGYVDTSGQVVIAAQFDEAYRFEGGIARVRKAGKLGLIDTQGLPLVPTDMTEITRLPGGILRLRRANGRRAYFDLSRRRYLWTETYFGG
jgi:hypothetical protein